MNCAAKLVIHYIGAVVILIVGGTIFLTGVGHTLPEWLKDPLLVGLGALAGLLAKTGADVGNSPNVEKAETVNVTNTTDAESGR